MSTPACNPIQGRRPVLQNCTLSELEIDPAYQRGIETHSSRALIRSIAQEWDWRLCQPLVVANRPNAAGGESLFVIDGQHRLAAARLRGDLHDLPCVIVASQGSGDEAALFKAINARRRPLAALDLFRAGCAEGCAEDIMIAQMITAAGLRLAPHTNYASWPAGVVANVSGIRRAIHDHGEGPAARALKACASAFEGEVLRYFGTIFPGVAQLLAIEEASESLLVMILQGQSQAEWSREIGALAAERGCHQRTAAAIVIRAAWAEATGEDEEELEAA